MVALTKPFFSLILATLVSTFVQGLAIPEPHYKRHGTHRTRTIGKRQVEVQTFHPKSTFKIFGTDGPIVPPSTSLTGDSPIGGAATAFIGTLGINASSVMYRSGFTEGNNKFAYVKQAIDGIPFANAVANVAFVGDQVTTFGSNFVDTASAKVAPSTPTVSWKEALPQIEDQLDAKFNNENVTLEFLVQPDGSVALAHVIQLQNDATGAFLEAYVDAHSGEILSVSDFVNDAAYTVLPITKQDILEGLETLVDPQDPLSSPEGWHSIGRGNSTTTSGNNVLSIKGQLTTVQSEQGLVFGAEYNTAEDPQEPQNVNAARQNAFYVLNVMHDFSYRYGFTESAFNFQLNNFGKGGRGNDRVLVSVQDASGVNNANFATPPDGQSGQCRMFIWNRSEPNRDGSLQNDILIHEMTHGITNRMTGGGTGRCLQTLESGGLGEGWGDAMADWMGQNSAQTKDYVIADFVFNRASGLRSFPYSTNKQTNPLTYAALRQRNQVHLIGEVWATMLHDVYAALVAARGFTSEKLTNPDAAEGNVVFMRLFMDALAIQPCNPTFVEARDAWIQADQNRFNGANICTVFRAFAGRGLGLRADESFTDDATLPAGC